MNLITCMRYAHVFIHQILAVCICVPFQFTILLIQLFCHERWFHLNFKTKQNKRIIRISLLTLVFFFIFLFNQNRMEEAERMERRERDKRERAKMSLIQKQEPEPEMLFSAPFRVSSSTVTYLLLLFYYFRYYFCVKSWKT